MQDKLNPISLEKRLSPLLIPFLPIFATLFIMGGTAMGYPGDQWILPIDHRDGGGYVGWGGAGYDGTTAYEAIGADPVRRVYWAMNGQSVSNTVFPITTEQYTIEWFQPTTGGTDWQPIESQFHGVNGETYPNDPSIPWAGAYGTSHQYIKAPGITGGEGTWITTGPGPQAPDSASYSAGPIGIYMWLTRGSWLYAKWDFGPPLNNIDHTWSALRLTQVTVTRPVFKSVTKSGNNVTLTWSAGGGGNYQVQYKTNLSQVGWSTLGGTIPAENLTTSTTDVNPPDARRYYRVQVLP